MKDHATEEIVEGLAKVIQKQEQVEEYKLRCDTASTLDEGPPWEPTEWEDAHQPPYLAMAAAALTYLRSLGWQPGDDAWREGIEDAAKVLIDLKWPETNETIKAIRSLKRGAK